MILGVSRVDRRLLVGLVLLCCRVAARAVFFITLSSCMMVSAVSSDF